MTNEITSTQFERYCVLRDKANDMEEQIFAATTLAEKLALKREQKRLNEEARRIINC